MRRVVIVAAIIAAVAQVMPLGGRISSKFSGEREFSLGPTNLCAAEGGKCDYAVLYRCGDNLNKRDTTTPPELPEG